MSIADKLRRYCKQIKIDKFKDHDACQVHATRRDLFELLPKS